MITKHHSDLPHYHRAVIYSTVFCKLLDIYYWAFFFYQHGLKPTICWWIVFHWYLYQECGAEKLHKIHKGCSYQGSPTRACSGEQLCWKCT